MAKPVHKNARKINYYVRMLVKDLLDEINAFIKDESCKRRLALALTEQDQPKSIAEKLSNIHKLADDDKLEKELSKWVSGLSNKKLSKTLLQEISSRKRVPVPDDKVPWKVNFKYKPAEFTAWPVLHTSLEEDSPKPFWADEDLLKLSVEERKKIEFNKMTELGGRKVDRRSREGQFELDDGLPLNPRGRTGMCGRGLLGRFGPNLAADPIVSRWKIENGDFKKIEGKKVLEVVFIQRRDNHEWALPGGMVEPGSEVSMTLIKEFREEALNICGQDAEKADKVQQELKEKLFTNGETIYEGYVDDPRNTDNAWMETVAKNFHDESDVFRKLGFELQGGDDAAHSKWQECSSSLKLYASHADFIKKTVEKREAHW